jgi:hypothetical protein
MSIWLFLCTAELPFATLTTHGTEKIHMQIKQDEAHMQSSMMGMAWLGLPRFVAKQSLPHPSPPPSQLESVPRPLKSGAASSGRAYPTLKWHGYEDEPEPDKISSSSDISDNDTSEGSNLNSIIFFKDAEVRQILGRECHSGHHNSLHCITNQWNNGGITLN